MSLLTRCVAESGIQRTRQPPAIDGGGCGVAGSTRLSGYRERGHVEQSLCKADSRRGALVRCMFSVYSWSS